jgi:hypothetical protein
LVRKIDRGTISNCFASEAGEIGSTGKDGGCGTLYTSAAGVSVLEIDDPTNGKDAVGLGGGWTFEAPYYPRPAGIAKSSLPSARRIAALAAVPILFNKDKGDSSSLVTGAFKVPTRTAEGRKLKWSVRSMNRGKPVMFSASGNATFPYPVEEEIMLIAEDGAYKKNFVINARVKESGASFLLDISELGLNDKAVRLERTNKKYDYYERSARVSGFARDIMRSFGSSPEAAEKILGRPFYRTSKRMRDEIVDGKPYNQVTLEYPGLKLSFGKVDSHLICESVSYATKGVRVGDNIRDVIKKLGRYNWSWGKSVAYFDGDPPSYWQIKLRFDTNGKIYKIETYWYLVE